MGRQGHQKRAAPRSAQARRFAAERSERVERETRQNLDEWRQALPPGPHRRDVSPR